MWSALTSRTLSVSSYPSFSFVAQQWKLGFNRGLCSLNAAEREDNINSKNGFLSLSEVEKVLADVRADDVRIFPVKEKTDFTDFVVVATGRSEWHVRNIAQALLYKVKQKQKGAKRMLLPSVEGLAGGKWIVIDSGSLIIHALDEKARSYYSLERLWAKEESNTEESQDLGKAFVKVRRKNNSKKPAKNAK